MSEAKKSFIIGYPFNVDVDPKNLKQFESKTDADFNSEEWCEVFALSFEEAKKNYEDAFEKWRKTQN